MGFGKGEEEHDGAASTSRSDDSTPSGSPTSVVGGGDRGKYDSPETTHFPTPDSPNLNGEGNSASQKLNLADDEFALEEAQASTASDTEGHERPAEQNSAEKAEKDMGAESQAAADTSVVLEIKNFVNKLNDHFPGTGVGVEFEQDARNHAYPIVVLNSKNIGLIKAISSELPDKEIFTKLNIDGGEIKFNASFELYTALYVSGKEILDRIVNSSKEADAKAAAEEADAKAKAAAEAEAAAEAAAKAAAERQAAEEAAAAAKSQTSDKPRIPEKKPTNDGKNPQSRFANVLAKFDEASSKQRSTGGGDGDGLSNREKTILCQAASHQTQPKQTQELETSALFTKQEYEDFISENLDEKIGIDNVDVQFVRNDGESDKLVIMKNDESNPIATVNWAGKDPDSTDELAPIKCTFDKKFANEGEPLSKEEMLGVVKFIAAANRVKEKSTISLNDFATENQFRQSLDMIALIRQEGMIPVLNESSTQNLDRLDKVNPELKVSILEALQRQPELNGPSLSGGKNEQETPKLRGP